MKSPATRQTRTWNNDCHRIQHDVFSLAIAVVLLQFTSTSLTTGAQRLQHSVVQESCVIAKMTAQCALGLYNTYGTCPGKFLDPWLRPWLLFFKKISWAFVSIDPMNVRTKFEVRLTYSWNTQKMGSACTPWIRLRSLFSKIFNRLLFGWTLWMYLPNLKSAALPVPKIIGVAKITRSSAIAGRPCDAKACHCQG